MEKTTKRLQILALTLILIAIITGVIWFVTVYAQEQVYNTETTNEAVQSGSSTGNSSREIIPQTSYEPESLSEYEVFKTLFEVTDFLTYKKSHVNFFREDLTQELIWELIYITNNSNFENEEYLLGVLTDWQLGDFRNLVDVYITSHDFIKEDYSPAEGILWQRLPDWALEMAYEHGHLPGEEYWDKLQKLFLFEDRVFDRVRSLTDNK